MANVRLNLFESFPVMAGGQNNPGDLTLHLNAVYIPGSISFNNVFFHYSVSGQGHISYSFGLYSLNAGTLSLANSAYGQLSTNNTFRSFITMITSAAQDITPGNWWFGHLVDLSVGEGPGFLQQGGVLAALGGVYSGFPVIGAFSVTTAALPASINTAAINKHGAAAGGSAVNLHIIISA